MCLKRKVEKYRFTARSGSIQTLAVFILQSHYPSGMDELWQTRVSGIKMGTSRIMRLDELSFEIRLERHATKGSSSRHKMRLVPVFKLV